MELQCLIERRRHTSGPTNLHDTEAWMLHLGPGRVEHPTFFLTMPTFLLLWSNPAVLVVVPARSVHLGRKMVETRIHVSPVNIEASHGVTVTTGFPILVQPTRGKQIAVVVVLGKSATTQVRPYGTYPHVEVVVLPIHPVVWAIHRRTHHVAS